MDSIIRTNCGTQSKIKKIHSKVDWIRLKAFIPQILAEETKRVEVLDQALSALGLTIEEIIKKPSSTIYKTQELVVLMAVKDSLVVELTGSWCSTDDNFERAKEVFKKLNNSFKEMIENKVFSLSRIDLATDWLNATPETLLPYDGNKKFLWWYCKNETHRPRHVLESSYFRTQKYTLVLYRKDLSLKIDKLADKKVFERKYLEEHKGKPITRLELRFEKTEVCMEFHKFLFEETPCTDKQIVDFGYLLFSKKRTIKLNEGQKLRKNMRNEENYEMIFKDGKDELLKSNLEIDEDFLTKSGQRPVNQKQRMLSGLINRARTEEMSLLELQELVALEFLKRNGSEGGSEAENTQKGE